MSENNIMNWFTLCKQDGGKEKYFIAEKQYNQKNNCSWDDLQCQEVTGKYLIGVFIENGAFFGPRQTHKHVTVLKAKQLFLSTSI